MFLSMVKINGRVHMQVFGILCHVDW